MSWQFLSDSLTTTDTFILEVDLKITFKTDCIGILFLTDSTSAPSEGFIFTLSVNGFTELSSFTKEGRKSLAKRKSGIFRPNTWYRFKIILMYGICTIFIEEIQSSETKATDSIYDPWPILELPLIAPSKGIARIAAESDMELMNSEMNGNSNTLFQNFHISAPDSCSSCNTAAHLPSSFDSMENTSSPSSSEAYLSSSLDSTKNTSSPSSSKEHIPSLYYQNPVLKGYADPDVLYYKGTYYLYATSSSLPVGYEVYVSKDLVNWEYGGIVMGEIWGMKRWYWAPDIMERNGKFYMLVSVNEHLGIATANSPLGPFIPEPHYLFEKSIDGHYFIDEDGSVYIFYVSWRPGKSYALYGLRMETDCITPIPSTDTLVISAAEEWETQKAPVAEAPYVLKHKGKYYLTYSGSHFESNSYAVGYATADSPLGPYKKFEGNPILSQHYKAHGPGHHCIVKSPDGQKMFILYHIHHDTDTISPRNICVDRIRFIAQKDTADRLEVYGPSVIPKPYPLEDK